DRPAGLSAGKQPRGGSLVTECGVAPARGDEIQQECGERLRNHDGLTTEVQPYLGVADLDVAERETADRGGPLGVEEDQDARDPVFRLDDEAEGGHPVEVRLVVP